MEHESYKSEGNKNKGQETNWNNFYEITKDRPPSELLTKAIEFVTKKDSALDLGAGGLKDTKYLLEQGFSNITVVDSEPSVELAVKELSSDKITFVESSYDNFVFPKDKYDLVNAQYALPFNKPNTFNETFSKLAASLKVGGIFTGQFFGVNDEWNGQKPEMTFHTLNDAKNLLLNFEIIEFREQDEDSRLANGTPKHWHAFHILAKRLD